MHRGVPFSFSLEKTMQWFIWHSNQQRRRCVPSALFRLPRDNRPQQKFISSSGQRLIKRDAFRLTFSSPHRISFSINDGCPNALCFFSSLCHVLCFIYYISLTQAMMRRKSRAIVCSGCSPALGKQNAVAIEKVHNQNLTSGKHTECVIWFLSEHTLAAETHKVSVCK